MAQMNSTLESMGSNVATNDKIATWAENQYGQSCAVFENCDPRHPPKKKDCPMVILYPMQKRGGMSQGVKSHHIGVSCVVHDDRQEEIAGVICFKGGRMVEELRALVFEVIANNIASNLHIEDVDTEYETIGEFPFVSAIMVILLTEEKLIGANPYE
ncbi:MAG: hypothetical protein GY710_17310 [Desulfobacteraceae bacterium]|nr:hypothetical protein [Desulfobacteraceae bacterium]